MRHHLIFPVMHRTPLRNTTRLDQNFLRFINRAKQLLFVTANIGISLPDQMVEITNTLDESGPTDVTFGDFWSSEVLTGICLDVQTRERSPACGRWAERVCSSDANLTVFNASKTRRIKQNQLHTTYFKMLMHGTTWMVLVLWNLHAELSENGCDCSRSNDRLTLSNLALLSLLKAQQSKKLQ